MLRRVLFELGVLSKKVLGESSSLFVSSDYMCSSVFRSGPRLRLTLGLHDRRRVRCTIIGSLVATLSAAALLSACKSSDGESQNSAPPHAQAPRRESGSSPAPTVNVVEVVQRRLEKTISLPGELLAYQSVALYPKTTGFVSWIGVDRGSIVKKGQVLVRLQAPELMAQRTEAEARVQATQSNRIEAESSFLAAESTYQRLKAAAATPGVVSGNELEVSQRNTEAQRARVEALRNNEMAAQAALRSTQELESYLTVTSPFDGVIIERNVHPGALVGSSGAGALVPMLRIEQISVLRLVVSIPEADVSGVSRGVKATFTTLAFPGESFGGIVERIAHSMDPKTRTMPVELEVGNPTGRLAAGMFAEVKWVVKRVSPTLFVPPTAVVTTTERMFVIRVKEGIAEWVDVRRGTTVTDAVEIFGAIHAGEIVVVTGTDELRPGTRVNAKVIQTTS